MQVENQQSTTLIMRFCFMFNSLEITHKHPDAHETSTKDRWLQHSCKHSDALEIFIRLDRWCHFSHSARKSIGTSQELDR